MITRTHDPELVRPAIEHFLKAADQVDPVEWLSNPENIALITQDGDMALFEKGVKHLYSGHYYFKSRGRKALEAGKELLDNLFNTCYNIDVLIGLTPIEYLGARWMSRQLGFKSNGVITIDSKHYEMFMITKEGFNLHE